MSNRIYITLDGRAAPDEELEKLMINYFPGRSEADIDVLNENGRAVDGARYGFRFQTQAERDLADSLRDLLDCINGPEWGEGLASRAKKASEVLAKATGT